MTNPTTKNLEIQIELRKPLQKGESLIFSMCWVAPETLEVLAEEKGWRIWRGEVQSPCTLYKKRYVSTVVPSPRLTGALEEMVQEWKNEFPEIQFPSKTVAKGSTANQEQSEAEG